VDPRPAPRDRRAGERRRTRVAGIGAGSWGTAVGAIAAVNADATLWARDPAVAARIDGEHANPDYLPGIALPDALHATADLLAAVTSWVVMVPVALAYAGLAGVPPELGLITAFTALAAYAVFGTSRHLKVTVSSTMAIMSAAVVVDLSAGDPAQAIVLTSALALTVGVLLVAGGIAKLGFIADFLTKSVVTGFIFGLAITIAGGACAGRETTAADAPDEAPADAPAASSASLYGRGGIPRSGCPGTSALARP